ncbi:MAG: amino acid ABC transporter substrate-binding protein [Bosea sp.]|uniref:amino acid ABC transporter substrate-binding protein n=1 Tax=Bosea sp. (in: a-proteobacteria) TaxID=1871050 RepID=UPI001AD463B6|nr:amino acid ABC transporter substrate-binding protein [Bosea sp. (in: a-proteobacteria)]MBN9454330.1 amino acid ABC transporter substrate-binding protein [Bosea sp. (in: a-proteobacteria)]
MTLTQQNGQGFLSRLRSLGLAGLALFGLAGTAMGQDTIKIGAAVSLTGNLAREGVLLRDGYAFWQDALNAAGGLKVGDKTYKVEVVYYDDESRPQTSAQLTEKLISQDKVNFIFGPYSSGIALATASISERYKVVTIAPMATADNLFARGFKYLFTNSPLSGMTAIPLIDVLDTVSPKPQTVAIVGMDDLFPNIFVEALKKRAEDKGFKVVYVGKYPKGAADLSAVVTALKAANPDVVMTSGFVQDSILLIRQMHELRFEPKLVGSAFVLNVPEVRSVLGPQAEGLVGVLYWDPSMTFTGPLVSSSADYAKAFREKFGRDPNHTSASATAAGIVLQQAVQNAGSLDNEAVRDALRNLKMETFFGPVQFDQRGANVLGPSLVIQVKNGTPVIVYPKGAAATADITYPRAAAR